MSGVVPVSAYEDVDVSSNVLNTGVVKVASSDVVARSIVNKHESKPSTISRLVCHTLFANGVI